MLRLTASGKPDDGEINEPTCLSQMITHHDLHCSD
jgi:hypothetical protein